jgi:hypothetical protein
MSQRALAPGLILIGLGALLLVVQATSIGEEAVVAVIGAGLLVTYLVTRIYGFLVPAGILLGLGLGIVWQVQAGGEGEGGVVLIGLGLGFVSIWLIGVLMRDKIRHWWPLIPGGILATIGALVEAEQTGFLRSYGDLWPLILVFVGVILLAVQVARPSTGDGRDEPPPTVRPESATPPPSEIPIGR